MGKAMGFRHVASGPLVRSSYHADEQYEAAAELRDRELQKNEDLDTLEKEWQEGRDNERPVVTDEDIAEVVSMWTGIPVTRLNQEETERLLHMEEEIHKRIIGQDEAIMNISKSVRRARARSLAPSAMDAAGPASL